MAFFDGAAQEFGRRLKAYRKRKRLAQWAMAENIGVSVTTLGAWERGDRRPHERTAYEIDEMLDLGIFVHSKAMNRRFGY